MIILIAESKTMENEELEISPEVYVENMPIGELTAGEVKAFANDTMFPISDYVYQDRIAFYV